MVPFRGTYHRERQENFIQVYVSTEIENLPAPGPRDDNRSKWANITIATKPIKVLSKEFAANKKYKPSGYTTEAYDRNEPKNRYNDIICIDSTRVILRDRSSDDDYIHASWMTMPDHFKYICTQGPLLETLEDFWHMIFCERSTVLVQLCNFVEGIFFPQNSGLHEFIQKVARYAGLQVLYLGKHEKCRQYFPKSKGSTESFGPYKVTNKETKPDPYDSVKHTVLEVESRGRTVTVNHFSYLVWPDHTAPANPAPMVGCFKLCRQLAAGQPITVHCSAGIGRSATFVAIDYAWQKIRENSDAQMIDVLKDLRGQRFQAIQSPIQYIFLHMCLLELTAEENLLPRKGKYAPYLVSYTTMLKKYNKKVQAAEARAEARGD
ncbi:Protein-tyrosine phosphatase [Ancylostoma duodenale]|uniref:Protein-tyrosine phosphatase n=1 Tax=Ancylostoma duodenale TaxID=51022 RepID=A0A0C2CRI7_9BILA|nr:Protein-tyrosine phosphatase [Ancylostoma duodenale]